MRNTTGLAALAAFILFSLVPISIPEHAAAAQSVGVTQRVQNQVTGSSGNRRLARQDPVYRSESISAGANSFGEIELSDGAKVLVGENSQVSLDNFVVSGGSFSRAGTKASRGTSRKADRTSSEVTLVVRSWQSTMLRRRSE